MRPTTSAGLREIRSGALPRRSVANLCHRANQKGDNLVNVASDDAHGDQFINLLMGELYADDVSTASGGIYMGPKWAAICMTEAGASRDEPWLNAPWVATLLLHVKVHILYLSNTFLYILVTFPRDAAWPMHSS